MRKGLIKVSKYLIQDALHFPPDWNIESIELNKQGDMFTMIISGDDFPEFVPIKECKLILHREAEHFEVKEV